MFRFPRRLALSAGLVAILAVSASGVSAAPAQRVVGHVLGRFKPGLGGAKRLLRLTSLRLGFAGAGQCERRRPGRRLHAPLKSAWLHRRPSQSWPLSAPSDGTECRVRA